MMLNETLSNTRRADKNVNIKRKQMIVRNGWFKQKYVRTFMFKSDSTILMLLNYLKD